jgi:hypothetical protein
MKKFDIEEGIVPVKTGVITLSRNAIIFLAVGASIIFTGSILATYYGKPSSNKCSDNTIAINSDGCIDLFCKDSVFLNSNLLVNFFH